MKRALSNLRISRDATPISVSAMRKALDAFLVAVEVDEDTSSDIITAVGEALANAVEHAYEPSENGDVTMEAFFYGDATLIVEVSDSGKFHESRNSENRGFGLKIVNRIASNVILGINHGTKLRMEFNVART